MMDQTGDGFVVYLIRVSIRPKRNPFPHIPHIPHCPHYWSRSVAGAKYLIQQPCLEAHCITAQCRGASGARTRLAQPMTPTMFAFDRDFCRRLQDSVSIWLCTTYKSRNLGA